MKFRMDQCVIGVDLGGTNVRAQCVADDGTLLGERFSRSSCAKQGLDAVIGAIASVVDSARNSCRASVTGVGLSIPGSIDSQAGVVAWAPNFGVHVSGVFQYWENVQIGAPLSQQLGLPVVMGNDANLAALGEYRYGTGTNSASCLVMLTVGTGIGGGVVMRPTAVEGVADGPLVLLGGNKGGAELGHVVIAHGGLDCSAGSYGAIEGYCQAASIIRRAQHKQLRYPSSVLSELSSGNANAIDGSMLTQAALAGCEVAKQTYAEVGEYLGVGIGNFINIFAPEVVAIGGNFANAGDLLLQPAREAAQKVAIPALFRYAKIVQAAQIDNAGILGAAALAHQQVGTK